MATSKIRIKRGTSQEIANSTAILPLGTPFYDTTNKYLYISNGEKAANLHECITTDRVETPNFITKQTDAYLTISAINNSEDYIKIGELTPHRLNTAPTVQLFSKVFVQDETLALVKEYNDLTITTSGITINRWSGDRIQYRTVVNPLQIETSGTIKGNISDNATIGGPCANASRIVYDIFEDDSNAVKDAVNVSSTINGKSISNIFESDGVTIKNATHASSAGIASEWSNAQLAYANNITIAQLHNKFDDMVAREIKGISSSELQRGFIAVYGNGIALLFCKPEAGFYYYSYDSINWTRVAKNLGGGSGFQTRIFYCNGKFFNAGGEYSIDGLNWEPTNISYIPNIYYISGVGRYYSNTTASGTGETYTSTDGITWTSIGRKLYGIPAYGNNKVVSYTAEAMVYSTDGLTWSNSSKAPKGTIATGIVTGNASDYKAIVFINDKFIFSSNELAYSYDGVNWVSCVGEQASWSRNWSILYNPFYTSSPYIGICDSGVIKSTDGITWSLTKQLNAYDYFACNFKELFIYCIDDNDLNPAGVSVYYSSNGISFTKAFSASSVHIQHVGIINDMMLVNTTNGTLYSRDGKNWAYAIGTEGFYTDRCCLANGRILLSSITTGDSATSTLNSKPFYIEPTFNAVEALARFE